MRKILFKAKRIDNGDWVMGGSIIQFLDDGTGSIYIPRFSEKCICTHDNLTDDITGFEDCRFHKVDPETICRFTGLKDKNGKLIFENDIIKCQFEDMYAQIKYGVYHSCFDSANTSHCGFYVAWAEDTYMRKDLGYWINIEYAEAVGNIFDNPEFPRRSQAEQKGWRERMMNNFLRSGRE